MSMLRELDRCFTEAERDSRIAVALISGAGYDFSRGLDVTEAFGMSPQTAEKLGYIPDVSRIRDFTRPVVCALEGSVKGLGLSIAEGCDICIAGEGALFQHDEILMGLTPTGGSTQSLSQLVGMRAATSMLLAGWTMDAEEALRRGLVSRVVPKGSAVAEATTVAQSLARLSSPVLKETKRLLRLGLQRSLRDAVPDESSVFSRMFALSDRVEGTGAALQGRAPAFKNR
jgi:enoyl-CoA hydratase/carnithine racemase